MVAWLQTYRLLAVHGAESTLPSFLSVAVIVELGPLLAGLLVAGRMGAGLAAELASMVQNEEIDARLANRERSHSLPGLAPSDRLCPGRPVIDSPYRCFCPAGSLVAELSGRQVDRSPVLEQIIGVPQTFGRGSWGLLKTAVFGLLIGLSACWTGLTAGSSPAAVGRRRHAGRGASEPRRICRQPCHGSADPGRRVGPGMDTMRSGCLLRGHPRCYARSGGGEPLFERVLALAVVALAWVRATPGRRPPVARAAHISRPGPVREISGIEAGHRVRIQGIEAGVVEKVVPPQEPGGPVELVLRLDERLRGLVRTDAVADRLRGFGRCEARRASRRERRLRPVAELDIFSSEKPVELTDLMQKAATSLARLDAATVAAEKGLAEVSAIAASVHQAKKPAAS